MCEGCNVSDEVRAEIEALSDAALNEIVRLVTDELADKNDLMIASILDHLDLTEVTLKRENVQKVHERMTFQGLKLEGNPSADESEFTFALEQGTADDSVAQLMKALGLV